MTRLGFFEQEEVEEEEELPGMSLKKSALKTTGMNYSFK